MTADERMQQFEQSVLAAAQAYKPSSATTFDEVFDSLQTPGVSLAVLHGGKLDWAKGYGVRLAGEPSPVTTDTVFQAASISKPVVALAALRMVEAGLLDLNADVNDYLRSWRVPAVDGWQPRITLRQLFSHTAGLTAHGFLGYHHQQTVPSVVEVLNGSGITNSEPVRVTGLPGMKHRYSGGGTTIAQLVMMDVTGKDFPALTREWVLDPLGMANSAYEHPLGEARAQNAAYAHHYTGLPVEGRWYTHPELAAAGLWTTPSDLLRFGLAVQQAYNGQHPVISQQVAQWMLTTVIKIDPENSMGIGFFLQGEGDALAFGHGGSNVGYKCDLRVYQKTGDGFAVMTNSDMGSRVASEFIVPALEKVYGWTPAPAQAPEFNTAYAGTYRLNQQEVTVHDTDGKLMFTLPGQPALPLIPAPDGRFKVGGLKSTVQFNVDGGNHILGLTLQQDSEDFTAERTDLSTQ